MTPAYLSAQLAHVQQRPGGHTPALFVAACRGNWARYDEAAAAAAAAARSSRDAALALRLAEAIEPHLIDPDDVQLLASAFGGWSGVVAAGVLTAGDLDKHSAISLRAKLLREARHALGVSSSIEPKPRTAEAAAVV